MSGRGLMPRYKWFVILSLALLLGLLPIFAFHKPASGAGTLPTGFSQSQVVSGLAAPTAMAFAPDGRLFVAEQGGKLRVIKDGQLLETPFIDVSGKINAAGERGLLGVAFDPDFATNNYIYVYYTATDGGVHNRVSRFTASATNGDVGEAGSETPIFELPPLSATNHNGGAIHFGQGAGEEDKLYVAVGENARPAESQSLNTVLGKMLRINKDGSIPQNPFEAQTTGNNKAIWALGLRNPYSFDVQPGTGRIFINDVGQQTYEEINDGIAGTNYGWPVYEGPVGSYTYRVPGKKKRHHNRRPHTRTGYLTYTGPLLYAYTHSSGCAITGGAFYNPPSQADSPFPDDYVGDYFFADFCGGWIEKFDPETKMVTSFKSGSSERPVDLKVSEEGDLYFLARGSGSVEKISYP